MSRYYGIRAGTKEAPDGPVGILATGRVNPNGTLSFDVVNGGWHGTLTAAGVLTIKATGHTYPAHIAWEGELPQSKRDYNEALHWINKTLGIAKEAP